MLRICIFNVVFDVITWCWTYAVNLELVKIIFVWPGIALLEVLGKENFAKVNSDIWLEEDEACNKCSWSLYQ